MSFDWRNQLLLAKPSLRNPVCLAYFAVHIRLSLLLSIRKTQSMSKLISNVHQFHLVFADRKRNRLNDKRDVEILTNRLKVVDRTNQTRLSCFDIRR